MQNGIASVEESLVVPQMLNIVLPYNPTISLPDIYLRELKTGAQTDICMHLFIAALFIIVQR